ncbi:MAG: aspartyl-phosphate phosphatase Spo0E family protein [Clostridia bacterium]|nr:aspartyl-phosphate phosphatase Spo0E family protein [Clostridia bacterium]
MTNDKEICRLRDKLQSLILKGADYNEICRVSQELDELIVKHYAMA